MRVIDLLENGIKRFPNRTCVVDEDISLTHAQALQMSHQIANGLSSSGLQRGSRVAIYSTNTALSLIAMIGIFRVGGVWLPIQTRNPLLENIEFLNENSCEFIFFHSTLLDDATQLNENVSTIKGMVCFDAPNAISPQFSYWIEQFDFHFPDDLHGPEDLAWIKGTGGTTGRPKASRYVIGTLKLCLQTSIYACL